MRVAVLGGGAWGTAVAKHVARRHPCLLWARDSALVADLRSQGENARYLPGYPLGGLKLTADLTEAVNFVGANGLILLASPMSALRPMLSQLAPLRAPETPVYWLCKGVERETGLLAHQVAAQVLVDQPVGVLSGPSFAQEVAQGLPFALVAASTDRRGQARVVAALHHGACRLYTSEDVVGVELAGAVKNVIAIAAGSSDGLALGLNARAALITRGLAEMTRLGLALGASAETFVGLAGIGDLMLTCTGELSRNRRVGFALAQGHSLEDAVAALGHVAEGVKTTVAVRELARIHAIDMPIVEAVYAVLFEKISVRAVVEALLARESRPETR
ncbi:MAG: NAD(P)-dependent glycerol-3-phosphate dehydrogenase [Betaproteobacteria bacterium]|nr:NAD(P)-dependent glycerol-3-phosphate dehydrogenase [Betaproteobacteria bacterium]NBY18603.1 NAD(P)-dependent glycerol-3-phosphate dehydrogenase [Betaproteobacteria bacterium]